MNTVLALLVDLDKCIGCYNCLIGCHIWNKVAENDRVEIVILDPVKIDGLLKADCFPLMTHNCDLCYSKQKPLCIDFCPTQALISGDNKELVTLLNSGRRLIVAKADKQLTDLGKKG